MFVCHIKMVFHMEKFFCNLLCSFSDCVYLSFIVNIPFIIILMSICISSLLVWISINVYTENYDLGLIGMVKVNLILQNPFWTIICYFYRSDCDETWHGCLSC